MRILMEGGNDIRGKWQEWFKGWIKGERNDLRRRGMSQGKKGFKGWIKGEGNDLRRGGMN